MAEKDTAGRYIIPAALQAVMSSVGVKTAADAGYHGADINFYTGDIDRFRRHDHGGGRNGDGWLPEEEIDADFEFGKKKHQNRLDSLNKALAENGFEPNAEFDLGEKGHFSLQVQLEPLIVATQEARLYMELTASVSATAGEFLARITGVHGGSSYWWRYTPIAEILQNRGRSKECKERLLAMQETGCTTVLEYWAKVTGNPVPIDENGELAKRMLAKIFAVETPEEQLRTKEHLEFTRFRNLIFLSLEAKGFTIYAHPDYEKMRSITKVYGLDDSGKFCYQGNNYNGTYQIRFFKKGKTIVKFRSDMKGTTYCASLALEPR